MRTLTQFVGYLLLALIAIVLGVILGDDAPWYFAWLVGTVMLVLVAAAGGAWMDTQDEEAERQRR